MALQRVRPLNPIEGEAARPAGPRPGPRGRGGRGRRPSQGKRPPCRHPESAEMQDPSEVAGHGRPRRGARPPRGTRPPWRHPEESTALVPLGHPESAELAEPSVLAGPFGKGKSKRQAKRQAKQAVRWSPPAEMGNLRISAPEGIRAAVVPLKPGLYLVAEVDSTQSSMAGSEFGAVGLITAITAAAKGALKLKQAADAQGVPVRELVVDKARGAVEKGRGAVQKGRELRETWQERREAGEGLRHRLQQGRETRNSHLLAAPSPIPPWSSVAGELTAVAPPRWGAWA